MKKIERFSLTQEAFRDYVLSEIQNDNRVIGFKLSGHFGAESVLENLISKAKIVSFNKIIKKKITHILKKFLGIATATVTGGLTLAGYPNVQAAAGNIVNNIIPEIEGSSKTFKYFLGYSFFNKKYRKIKKIVYISNFDELNNEEIIQFKILKALIENKKIPRTLLIVGSREHGTQLLNRLLNKYNLPCFSLVKADIQWFLQEKGCTDIFIKDEDVPLIRSLGLDFLLNYYEDIIAFTKSDNISNAIQKTKFFIDRILSQSNINATIKVQLNSLLNFASIFHKYFTKLQVANYCNNILVTSNLDEAAKLSILKKEFDESFTFNYEIFREYYYNSYKSALMPTPKNIFNYVNSTLSFQYITQLRIIDIDPTVCNFNSRLAIIIKAYYFACIYGNSEDRKYILEERYCKTNIELSAGLLCFEKFLVGQQIVVKELENFKNFIIFNSLEPTATAMALVMILQMAKECIKNWVHYEDVLDCLKNAIINFAIENKEDIYWHIYFKELYIAFSLESENFETKTVFLFKKEIEDAYIDYELNDFILLNKPIKKLNRIALLSVSIDDYVNAEMKLSNIINTSNDLYTINLALINLSVLYIESMQWKSSHNVIKKIDSGIISNINSDTWLSYRNNDLLTKLFQNKIKTDSYILKLNKLITSKSDFADVDIIKNNYYAAKIENKENYVTLINLMQELIKNSNKFSQFYARNNLMYIYFKLNNLVAFEEERKKQFSNYPILLSNMKSFFEYKYDFIRTNWNNKNLVYINVPTRFSDIPKMYTRLIMFGGIERWFE